ncbi:MAG TPA: histidine phosphatase family protein [Acetobacteraceae bacterium]|nr:histidine phosphatase family protein [Acetobacteraceae bacterium]
MILLRHGESEFNRHFSATKRDPGIRDPALTENGHSQAMAALAALSALSIRRIVVSPYTRALQTAAPFATALGVPVSVHSLVGERFAFTCDIGSPRSALERSWPEHDFSALPEIWWPAATESEADVNLRAARFRAEIAAEAGSGECLVITHWGFILALTGQRLTNGAWLRYDPAEPQKRDERGWDHHRSESRDKTMTEGGI